MPTNDSPILDEQRRRFLRCSAAATAAFALSRGVAPTATVHGTDKSYTDPSSDYPWEVAVDFRGQVLLFLVDRGRIDKIQKLTYETSVYDILRKLERTAGSVRGDDLVELEIALGQKGYQVSELERRIKRARYAIRDAKIKSWTYRDFAENHPTNWYKGDETSVALEKLADLDKVMTFPPLRCDREEAKEFFAIWSGRIDDGISFKNAFAEGIRSPFWSSRKLQIAAIRDGRDTGLFWCYPKGSSANFSSSAGSIRSDFDVFVVDPPEGTQGQRCIDGQCITTGNPEDYCQTVDNSCTPMSG